MSENILLTHEKGQSDLSQLLHSLLSVSVQLHDSENQQGMLETILLQARQIAGAEAGSFYLTRHGKLTFAAVQNARVGDEQISSYLLGKEIAISADSLAGYTAMTKKPNYVPDSRRLSPDVPFHIDRQFETVTGYHVDSLLAIPLTCPDGQCVGVLELFNHRDEDGSSAAFREADIAGLNVLCTSAAIALHNIVLHEQLQKAYVGTVFRLSAIAEYRDTDTGEHIHRVSRTSEIIAHAMGLDHTQVQLVRYASPMHDVGKVAIPDAILLKPGYLTVDQRRVMERHTTVGAQILSDPDDALLSMAREMALYHHERWDGEGYPERRNGEATPLVCRIVALADVFDAIVSRRCYKDACSLDIALDILRRDREKHFDPAVLDAFLGALSNVLEAYPAVAA
jgi:HD-GYP domain-containing protein (c-di-GMP phosphodiesterase class II)